MPLSVDRYELGPIRTNCYAVRCDPRTTDAVVVDPSQGTGRWSLVRPMSLVAVAAGAHGVIVEVHPKPDEALSDGAQSLDFEAFDRLMAELKRLTEAMQREPA